MITRGLEDYIELIYNSILNGEVLRAIDISKRLDVSRASVSEALFRLKDLGLITYNRKDIKITKEGIIEAKKVINKHKILYSFFFDILGLDFKTSSKNACEIEHVIDKKVIETIDKFSKFCIKNNINNTFKNNKENKENK